MSNSELINRISELETQNRTLLEENKKLRGILGLPLENAQQEESVEPVRFNFSENDNKAPITNSSINKYSSPEEKIDLFMSLFRGRADVYAKRCYSKKHKSSY